MQTWNKKEMWYIINNNGILVGISLDKDLAEVNNSFCSEYNKVQEIANGKFLPINGDEILIYQAECKV